MNLPPLLELEPWAKCMIVREDVAQMRMREYGALCRRQALEEVIDHFQRKHELCKTRHNYWQCAAIEIGELK